MKANPGFVSSYSICPQIFNSAEYFFTPPSVSFFNFWLDFSALGEGSGKNALQLINRGVLE